MKILKPLHYDQSGRIALKVNNRQVFVKIRKIIYCKANGNYSIFHVKGNKHFAHCENLGCVEAKLRPYGFFTIDKSLLVNLRRIRGISQGRCSRVYLKPETELKVARNRKCDLFKVLFPS